MIDADLLILLTDIDALYDKNPKLHPDAKRISYVEKITPEIEAMAGEKGSTFSVGGMQTKLEAGTLCEAKGIRMVIASGEEPESILSVVEGKDIGTLFGK